MGLKVCSAQFMRWGAHPALVRVDPHLALPLEPWRGPGRARRVDADRPDHDLHRRGARRRGLGAERGRRAGRGLPDRGGRAGRQRCARRARGGRGGGAGRRRRRAARGPPHRHRAAVCAVAVAACGRAVERGLVDAARDRLHTRGVRVVDDILASSSSAAMGPLGSRAMPYCSRPPPSPPQLCWRASTPRSARRERISPAARA